MNVVESPEAPLQYGSMAHCGTQHAGWISIPKSGTRGWGNVGTDLAAVMRQACVSSWRTAGGESMVLQRGHNGWIASTIHRA